MDKYEILKLENQICFPLYAAAKEVVRTYQPFLEKLDLTYTQYIAMLVLWEKEQILIKELGKLLYLDSGTLTPLVKKLEIKGYVERIRPKEDERNLLIKLTDKGRNLKDQALNIPFQVGNCINITQDEAIFLHQILNKILISTQEKD